MAIPAHPPVDESVPAPALPAVDLLDYVLFWPFFIVFLAILVVFDPLIRIGVLISRRTYLWIHELFCWSIVQATKLVGARIQLETRGTFDPCGQYIIAANHQSFVDIPLLRDLFYKQHPRFVAKKELTRYIPGVSVDLRVGEHGVVDRGNPRQALRALEAFCNRLKETKLSAVIFPEGTRARNGRLREFRGAGFLKLLAELPDVPVLPVTIDGSWILGARKIGPIPRGTIIHVIINEPLDRSKFGSAKEIVDEVYKITKQNLIELRNK